MNELRKRIIDISYKNKSSHIGSCLICVELIDYIYELMRPNDIFILSNGHAGLAQYVVMEKRLKMNAESLFKTHGTHPNRSEGIFCSTGSLGHGIGIALGAALVDPTRLVYCMVSDGEANEGSFWEALRIAADNKLRNLVIFIIANGYGAYDKIDSERLQWRIGSFIKDEFPKILFNKIELKEPHIQEQDAHYMVLTEQQYNDIIKFYKDEEIKDLN